MFLCLSGPDHSAAKRGISVAMAIINASSTSAQSALQQSVLALVRAVIGSMVAFHGIARSSPQGAHKAAVLLTQALGAAAITADHCRILAAELWPHNELSAQAFAALEAVLASAMPSASARATNSSGTTARTCVAAGGAVKATKNALVHLSRVWAA